MKETTIILGRTQREAKNYAIEKGIKNYICPVEHADMLGLENYKIIKLSGYLFSDFWGKTLASKLHLLEHGASEIITIYRKV